MERPSLGAWCRRTAQRMVEKRPAARASSGNGEDDAPRGRRETGRRCSDAPAPWCEAGPPTAASSSGAASC
eukprot:13338231-Alexandrium_andersonii.AAC.1